MDSLKTRIFACRHPLAGLACSYSWLYYSFFSCGLIPQVQVVRSIERVWVWFGLGLALTAGLLAVFAWRQGRVPARATLVVGALAAGAGTLVVWCGFLSAEWFRLTMVLGGLLCGIGYGSLAVCWGALLRAYDEESIETIVASSFAAGVIVYVALFALKGPFALVVEVLLPVGSAVIAWRIAQGRLGPIGDASEGPAAELLACNADGCRRSGSSREAEGVTGAGVLPLAVVLGMLWFQFAYFRLLATPGSGFRVVSYLTPFSLSLLLSLAILLVYARRSRFMSFALIFRWSVPLLMVGYALLYAFHAVPAERVAASTVGFMAMAGAQFAFWTAMPKYVRRTGLPPVLAFGVSLCLVGVGTGLGAEVGLRIFDLDLTLEQTTVLTLLLYAILLLAVTTIGFTPRYSYFGRLGTQRVGLEEAVWNESRVEDAFDQRARRLGLAYGLSRREVDVAALVLMGKSRAYMRDELMVSLNTIHTHVRSIYAKCGVHSRQELMDLMDALPPEGDR